MTADTGMNDKQKLKRLRRMAALTRNAEELIYDDKRSAAEVDVLLLALQSFKEGRLAAVLPRTENIPVEKLFEFFDLPVTQIAFSKEDIKYLRDRGIRYVGELYYVWCDPRGHKADTFEKSIMRTLGAQLGIDLHLDPLGLNWKPAYWSESWFRRDLDVIIVERHPVPEMPDGGAEAMLANRDRFLSCWYGDDSLVARTVLRGLARQLMQRGAHAFGQLLAFGHGLNPQCPPRKRSQGDMKVTQAELKALGSSLWAGALLPTGWHAPTSDTLQNELDRFAREWNDFNEFVRRHPSISKESRPSRFDAPVATRL